MKLSYWDRGDKRETSRFDDTHDGGIFLIGSSPRIYDLLPGLHKAKHTFVLNRALLVYPYPTYWAGIDYWPSGFSSNPLFNKDVVKFSDSFRINDPIEFKTSYYGEAVMLRDLPNTFFFTRDTKRCWNEHFFTKDDTLAYFDSTFMIALQLIWRMGFRKVYLCGCTFDFNADNPYCYKDEMSEERAKHNAECYPRLAGEINEFIPMAREEGFEIFRCDKESNLEAPFADISTILNPVVE